MDVVGYTDVLSAAPGDAVRVMVSCRGPEFRAEVIRLIHGDGHPDGPGFKAVPVASNVEGSYTGHEQPLRRGSHLEIPAIVVPPTFGIAISLWATTPGRGRQGLLGQTSWRDRGFALTIEDDRSVALWIAGRKVVATAPAAIASRAWYHLAATVDRDAGAALIGLAEHKGSVLVARASLDEDGAPGPPGPLWIGAADQDTHFNGKLEAPIVFERALSETGVRALLAGDATAAGEGVLARWDFAGPASGRRVPDASGGGHDGRLVNFPTRAVTGSRWTGEEVDFRLAPEQYAAIHFHDDDLDDAGWPPALTWTVPGGLPSGVYGIRLSCGDAEDIVPVFVRPQRGTAGSRIALLLPTFSYLAYANQHIRSEPRWDRYYREVGSQVEYPVQPEDLYIAEEQLHSLYDLHSDGSGVSYSSWLRPLVTMRPGYRQSDVSLTGLAAHQLAADLHLVDWLYERNFEVDVITDGDLHEEGVELLSPYQVVITGTHPEYVSWEMLEGLESYLDGGGRVMYLGGNGFYWVTGVDPEEGHTIEVRRWGAATRTWDAMPGEWHLSTTATLGGLWRYRGRTPHRLFGVGFTAQGVGASRSYERTAISYDPRYSFVFDDLDDDREIGHERALVNERGAAGFEVDRHDPEQGSPGTTVVLAAATGFSDLYQHVIDEVLESDSQQGGTVHPDVRADMVLVQHDNGGAVFSPGSITWCSCLSADRYRGSVSRVTENVLRRFLEEEPLPGAEG